MPGKILLVNYDFPPALSGVRRIVKFAKYLPQYGFEPVVVAAKPNPGAPMDFEALKDVEKQGYQVVRTPSWDPHYLAGCASARLHAKRKRHSSDQTRATDGTGNKSSQDGTGQLIRLGLKGAWKLVSGGLYPIDDRSGWVVPATAAAERVLNSQKVPYVLTSSYPNSTHLIGLRLKRKYKIMWIADFRDGWTQNPYFARNVWPPLRAWSRYREREVVRRADAVITVSEPIAEYLGTISGREKVFVIPNGFDEADYVDLERIPFDKFTLAYTGTLFMQRTPENLFAAVRGLLDSYPGLEESFQIIFRTKFAVEHLRAIEDLGLGHVIQNWGLGTHREALQLQVSADALLVIEGEAPNAEIMLTQKIFEYLAAKKPIICVAPPGALATLVKRTRSGVVIPPDNAFRIKETLYEAFNGQLQFHPDEELVASFSRRRQAEELSRILERL